MSKNAILIALVALGVLAVGGIAIWLTSGSNAELRNLERNQQKWERQDLAHYQVDVNIICFCPFADRLPLTVEVFNGEIISVTDGHGQSVAEDDPIRSMSEDDLLTVEGLFAYARRALQEADSVNIEYEPTLGYPTTIGVDWIKEAMDDEMGVHISALHALP